VEGGPKTEVPVRPSSPPNPDPLLRHRYCEERSDAAMHGVARGSSLPWYRCASRFMDSDGGGSQWRRKKPVSLRAFRKPFSYTPRICHRAPMSTRALRRPKHSSASTSIPAIGSHAPACVSSTNRPRVRLFRAQHTPPPQCFCIRKPHQPAQSSKMCQKCQMPAPSASCSRPQLCGGRDCSGRGGFPYPGSNGAPFSLRPNHGLKA
jgi:hypothetical protein